ncbi:MAG: zf-HC2 domain-containing protein [Acidobacteriota bacterium]|nr:zf-HC2 domain-containing protein [Acidobacteriota bacterium]
MTCRDLEDQTTEYLEGALSPPARLEFEVHLAVCPECRARLDEMRALIETSHDLGRKINHEWRDQASGTEAQYFQRLQARALEKSSSGRKRSRRLAPAAIILVVVAIAAGVWFGVRPAMRSVPTTPQNLTIDLSHWLLLRGADQPQQPPVKLKRALLNLTILQPVGTLPGKYQVAVLKNGKVLVQGAATANFENHLTALHVRLDCRDLKKGDGILAIRKDSRHEWEHYPVVVP